MTEMTQRATAEARRKRTRSKAARVAVVAVAALVVTIVWRALPHPTVPASADMLTAVGALMAATPTAAPPPSAPEDPQTDRERLLARAFELEGTPYVWGAKGPDAFDCSGFTKAAYDAAGANLPDGSFNQADGEMPLTDPSVLTPGDLLFYRWNEGDGVSHVTLYAGSGWVLGTGSPGQLLEVVLYPLSDDLVEDGRVITYRHVRMPDEE